MQDSPVVLVATPHLQFGNGLRAMVHTADPSLTVVSVQNKDNLKQLLQTSSLALLIIDAVLLRWIQGVTPWPHCLVVVHSRHQERTVREQQLGDVLYTDITTQALKPHLQRWLMERAL